MHVDFENIHMVSAPQIGLHLVMKKCGKYEIKYRTYALFTKKRYIYIYVV